MRLGAAVRGAIDESAVDVAMGGAVGEPMDAAVAAAVGGAIGAAIAQRMAAGDDALALLQRHSTGGRIGRSASHISRLAE